MSADRAPPGLGPPGAIPWTAIDAFARRIALPEDEFFEFANAVRQLDSEYLAIVVEQMADKTKR